MDSNKRNALIGLGVLLIVGIVAGVILFSQRGQTGSDAEATPTGTLIGENGKKPDGDDGSITPLPDYEDDEFVFTEDMSDIMFSHNGYFYGKAVTVKIYSRRGGDLYYTTDGSEPTASSQKYEDKGISLMAAVNGQPKVYPLQVKAIYDDGTESDVFVHTYFIGSAVEKRYTTLVFSIVGDPNDLTNAPDGIFYGDNYKLRGQESERPIHLELINAEGEALVSQFAGIRIYGGVSRESFQKSMKFYARKSYDANHGSFRLSCFDELRQDGTNTQVLNYDKFVLRNCGNDFQFAYIRDELNQTLAARAGFQDYEAVLPAIAYRNGEYVGFYWLHASYCDDYFKTKYGANPTAPDAEEPAGEFVILEGGDTFKKADEDDELQTGLAEEYEAAYADFTERGVTNDEVYEELRAWMDVENYLDYFAYNIYLCNKDWPNNNYKCYRYCAGTGETYAAEGAYDGRWRYLLHDIDYTLGLYEQTEVLSSYNTLKQILTPGNDRYSPLFAQLMERSDCREYFVKRSLDFGNGALSASNILQTLEAMNAARETEMGYYYSYLEGSGNPTVWTNRGHFDGYTEVIRTFASTRAARSAAFLKAAWNLGDTYELEVNASGDAKLQINRYVTEAGEHFTGTYFADYETEVSAVLPYGLALDYWEVNGNRCENEILHITAGDIVNGAVQITLHTFETALTQPLVYEISSNNSDFVTLRNPSDEALDLSGYSLTDGNFTFAFPAGTTLAAGDTLTVYCNNYNGELPENALQAEFNLSEGERLELSLNGEAVSGVSIPRLHSGFVYRFDPYTGGYREVAPE